MPKPQHLTLSVSPKGKVHFVPPYAYYGRYQKALCLTLIGSHVGDETFNLYPRPVTCNRCLAEMEKRGWGDEI